LDDKVLSIGLNSLEVIGKESAHVHPKMHTSRFIWRDPLNTYGRLVAVLVLVDHFGILYNGIKASERATGWEALEPVRQAVRDTFGDVWEGVAEGVELRHEPGSPFMTDAFLHERKFLGINSSPAFVR
jgi:hypothetical protein